jgi:hypothetical protein
MLPETAPSGYWYYIATASDSEHKATKFVNDVRRRPRQGDEAAEVLVTFSPIIKLGKRFNRLSIVRAYAEMLNRQETLEHDFCVVLRAE